MLLHFTEKAEINIMSRETHKLEKRVSSGNIKRASENSVDKISKKKRMHHQHVFISIKNKLVVDADEGCCTLYR